MLCFLMIFILLYVAHIIVNAKRMEEYRTFLIALLDDDIPFYDFEEIREDVLYIL